LLNQQQHHITQRVKVILAGISALILSVGIARFAYTPFLPLMLDQTSLSTLEGGWLATFNYIGYLMGVLLISVINDLKLKYMLYRVYLMVAVISTCAMALTTNIIFWSGLRLISGITSTAGIILAAGFVMSWLKHHDFKADLGIHFSGLGLGIAIPGLIIVVMNNYLDWAGQWLIAGCVGLVFLLPAWLWMPAPIPHDPNRTDTIISPAKYWMKLMVAAYFCAGVGYVISSTFIVAILEEMPLLTGKGDWIWVMLGITAIPSCYIWDKLAYQLGEIRTLMLSYLCLMISIVIPALTNQLLFNLLGAMLFGFTFAGIVSLMLVYIGHKFPQNPAKAMAKLTISYGVAQIISPAVVGIATTKFHSYSVSLWGAAFVMLVGVILLAMIFRLESKS